MLRAHHPKKQPFFRTCILILVCTLLPFFFLTGCDDDDTTSQTDLKTPSATPEESNARYVFLFIGDGMAAPQIHAAEIYKAALAKEADAGLSIKAPMGLAVATFPAEGIATTYSANSYITDSAAAGTAIACGEKTESGVISMDVTKTKSLPTLAEKAKQAGMKVGIVSSVSIDHATPASFYAHTPSRNNYFAIGQALVNSGFDYFGGGGFRENKYPEGKTFADDILAVAKANGYTYVNDRKSFAALSPDAGKVIAVNAVRDSSNALPYDMDRDRAENNNDLSLAEYTEKGISLLENHEKGFFMMVEGGKIDWACHANDATAAIQDTIAFDDAVKVALAFYNRHPEETLIIVTGDHECGGMTLGFAGTGYSLDFSAVQNQKGSYQAFDSSIDWPSVTSLADLHRDIEAHFGLDMDQDGTGIPLSAYEQSQLTKAFTAQVDGKPAEGTSEREAYNLAYGYYNPVSVTLTHILNQKAGIGWTSYSHTGIPVPVYAIGATSTLYNGSYDNTDLYTRLMQSLPLDGAS